MWDRNLLADGLSLYNDHNREERFYLVQDLEPFFCLIGGQSILD